MSDELIVRHCSPTLAGMKTGNLFSCPYIDKQELLQSIRFLNKRLVPKGVRVIPLKLSDNRVLLYVYRPNKLKLDLAAEDASKILKEYGYSLESPAQCVAYLSQRLYASKEFPHEIGLFLGYPPEDVRGFIDNHAEEYKCVGCWKVYGDESRAKKNFDRYKRCTNIYCSQWASGTNIEKLTVTV
ncbi:MAG: DUF3793 family protein [Lachnospiraceae bacterium]